jgi:hypothetical protein
VRFTDIYSERRAEEQYWKEVMSAEPGDTVARESSKDAVPALNPAELLSAFQELLERLKGTPAATTDDGRMKSKPEPKPRIRPVRTPRSEAPLALARPAELLRPEFAKGRLYFSCPCCRFPAALPKWLAGQKARCPRCYSAIRAPHPRKGSKARILENDIEALLHPERFSEYRNAHRLVPWLGWPRPKFEPSFHTMGVLILLALVSVFVPLLMTYAPHRAPAVAVVGRNHSGGPDLKERARRVVEQFLAGETVAARAAYVRDSERVAPLMADWYRRHPGLLRPGRTGIEVSGAGFYSAKLDHPKSDVRVTIPGRADQIFTVEHLPGGDRIEWESSVGYNTDLAGLFSAKDGQRPQIVRVAACLDDYYNFEYPDSGAHFCVRLHDPETLERIGYGYVPTNRADAGLIAASLAGSGPDELRPMMVEVRPAEHTAQTRQVEIVSMLESGWRSNLVAAHDARE